MKWNNRVREGALKGVFDALEEAFTALRIDYYLIGALARDLWYARAKKTFRTTNDADFAILVGSGKEYEALKQYLVNQKGFTEGRGNAFVLFAPGGEQVDILPFGSIEIDDGVQVVGAGLSSIKVNGFMEVYQSGTEALTVTTGHQFKVATLPAIVLLKLVAYDDRPHERFKDPRDIANILVHYLDLQTELIYSNEHNGLFLQEERSLGEIAAVVLGREVKKICAPNAGLHHRVLQIVGGAIAAAEESPFVREMTAESRGTVEDTLSLLRSLEMGLQT